MLKENYPALWPNQKKICKWKKSCRCASGAGFIFQSSEIYGGINGFWDYGPLGAELKRNVKELWWHAMTRQRDDVAGLEATIIMSPQIWKASGHVDTFADLMRECPMTKKRVRADQIEPQSGTVYRFYGAIESTEVEEYASKNESFASKREAVLKAFALGNKNRYLQFGNSEQTNPEVQKQVAEIELAGLSPYHRFLSAICNDVVTVLLPTGKPIESAAKKAAEYYQARGIKNPTFLDGEYGQIKDSVDFHPESGFELTKARPFNLMFKTYVGPVESEDNVAYLRPETAQAIFAQFKNVLETSRQKVPFGIAQIGKAFRNEVTPRNFTFRSREFEQMELEFFIKPDEAIEAICGSVADAGWPKVHPGEPQPNWGWQMWHQILGRGAHPVLRRHRPAAQHAGRVLADAGGTGALRPRLRGYFVQVPVQQARRKRRVDGRGTRRHRRAQRFRFEPAPAFFRQADGRV